MREWFDTIGDDVALKPLWAAGGGTNVQTIEQIGDLALRDLADPAALVLVLMEGTGRIAEHFVVQLFRENVLPTIAGHLCKNFQQQPPPSA